MIPKQLAPLWKRTVAIERRSLIAMATLAPLISMPTLEAATKTMSDNQQSSNLILSDFTGDEPVVIDGAGWRGFSDRVMGGISTANLERDTVGGKKCARLTGDVTRKSNGGFIQMAIYFGVNESELDASGYAGAELLVYGNNEDYNVHVRTADCGWHSQSYRHTFFAKPEWQTVRIPWSAFTPNELSDPLDNSRLTRIAVLGWMREFKADIALAELSLYR